MVMCACVRACACVCVTRCPETLPVSVIPISMSWGGRMVKGTNSSSLPGCCLAKQRAHEGTDIRPHTHCRSPCPGVEEILNPTICVEKWQKCRMGKWGGWRKRTLEEPGARGKNVPLWGSGLQSSSSHVLDSPMCSIRPWECSNTWEMSLTWGRCHILPQRQKHRTAIAAATTTLPRSLSVISVMPQSTNLEKERIQDLQHFQEGILFGPYLDTWMKDPLVQRDWQITQIRWQSSPRGSQQHAVTQPSEKGGCSNAEGVKSNKGL